MPVFRYKAATADGQIVEGELEGANQEAVIRQIQARGQVPIRAVARGGAARAASSRRAGTLGGGNELLVFTAEFATLLQAGLAVDKALELLAGAASDARLQTTLADLQGKVRGGSDLSSALSAHPELFSSFYVSMVRAGEAGGELDSAMARLASFVERARAVRDSVISALIYPIILLVVAVLSLAVILGVVVPRVSQMFADAGQSLPWYTQIVVAGGDLVAGYWWAFVAAGVLGTVIIRSDYATEAGRRRWDALLLRTPIVGNLIRKLEAARFSRSLAAMLGNGVELLEAVGISRGIVNNAVIAGGVERMIGAIRGGEGLAAPMLREGVLPEMAAKLIHVGEESGQLVPMLSKVADIYEREVANLVNRMVSVLAPALVLGLAGVIFVIMVTLIVPIITLNRLGF